MKTTNNHMAVRIQVMIPALLFLMLSCDQYELSSASDKPLVGTVWKLEGFGADNGKLTEARPNNEDVYLLYLQKNANVFGTTSVNTFRAEYKVATTTGTLNICPLGITKINEQQDGKRYIDCLSRVTRYQYDNTTLRLYYSEKEYLQYRPATDDTSFKEEIDRLFGGIAW